MSSKRWNKTGYRTHIREQELETASCDAVSNEPKEVKLPLELEMSGALARIYRFVRKGGRCPSLVFLNGCEQKWVKRLRGSFQALTVMGREYVNSERFKPLSKSGKPLWEFKEHAHRLYCVRTVRGNAIEVILLHGWIKEKEGQSKEEDRHIATAIALYEEYLAETKTEKTK